MKKNITFFVVILTFCAFVPLLAQDAISADVIEAFKAAGLPVNNNEVKPIDFTLDLLDGSSVNLSALKGKVVFLNFWATWCSPCRKEMPSMDELYNLLKAEGFEIIAVNLREKPNDVSRFMTLNKLNFPVAIDSNGDVGAQYNIRSIPTTYIIDKRGFIISKLTGSINWNQAPIISALRTLLK